MPQPARRWSGTERTPTSTSAGRPRTWTPSRPAWHGEGSLRSQLFIERFELPGDVPTPTENSDTESIVIRLDRRKHTIGYQPGDTILDAARRAGLSPPFSCERGNCATCMAHLDEGSATMRVNNALSADEVEAGWVLTCQAVPTSREVVVDYDR